MSERVKQLEMKLFELKQELAKARQEADPEPITKSYTFTTAKGGRVTLEELFGDKDELIVVHNMGKQCPYCTLWADGFTGLTKHLNDRFAFVLSSPDDPETHKAFAESRGWDYRTVSLDGNDFAKDMGYEGDTEDTYGRFKPGVSAFRKNPDGTIMRTGTSPFGPGDDFCAIWHFMDLTPEGVRGWSPKYAY